MNMEDACNHAWFKKPLKRTGKKSGNLHSPPQKLLIPTNPPDTLLLDESEIASPIKSPTANHTPGFFKEKIRSNGDKAKGEKVDKKEEEATSQTEKELALETPPTLLL